MATGGGKVGGVDGRVLDILGRTGGLLVSPPQYFADSEDASSEDAAGPSRSEPATATFVVSGPAAVAGPSGLTQQPPTLQQPPFQPTPQATPRESQAPPHRQSKQQDLEGAVHMATAEYVRQGQSAEARAQEEARFRRQMLEQNQRYGTPRQHVPFTCSDVPTYFAVIFFCRCVI
ncbi:uncharacterized protein [Dermacentor albipictus]|uniref:uncharacterized protein n=1 Tax=Dermacentor albipictus TaxID=60249 RepID=UPI0038FC3BAA